MRHFLGRALLDGNLNARSERQVESRNRRGDIERHSVLFRQNRERICADFIRDVSIRRDPVCADHYTSDPSRMEKVSRHIIRDDLHGNSVMLQFPRREPCSLQERTSLIRENIDLLSRIHRGADHSQGRPISCGGESARITMRQDRLSIRNQPGAISPDFFTNRDILAPDLLRFFDQSRDVAVRSRVQTPHALDRPEKIHRRGPRRGKRRADRFEILAVLHAQRHPHRRCDADCRSAANGHVANRLSHLLVRPARDENLLSRQQALIDHHYARVCPHNGFDHETPLSRTATLKVFMSRKRFEWRLRDRTLQLGDRTLIMGVLNVTPDSFSDGGKYHDPDRAFARAVELEEQGADLIDIGAESTRPGSGRISEAEELRRLVPVLKRLRNKLAIPISVDTYKASVAEKALDLGADAINDPSGLTFDADLARKAAQSNAGLILNHMRGTPETWAKLPPLKNVMRTIASELDASVHRAVRAGLDRRRLIVDPGIGFGKRKEQNAEILAQLQQLASLELPVLVGPSRKQFLMRETAIETEFASAAAVTAAILHGANMVRVHDVKGMKAAVEVADEILRSGEEA